MLESDLTANPASPARASGTLTSLGAWAFKNRSWLPVPLALALIFVRRGEIESPWTGVLGVTLVLGGIALRLWAVRQIGAISRTRASRLGPLVTTGPYAFIRHPLYVANFFLWTGLVVLSELLWMLPLAWAVFVVQYGAIIAWEESLLSARFPIEYPAYCARVSRWWPRAADTTLMVAEPGTLHPWPDVLFSERGTFLAVAAMVTLLTLKELLG